MLVNLRQIALEAFLDDATSWSGIGAGEYAVCCVPVETCQQYIRRQRDKFALLLDDGDVRHVSLSRPQHRPLVAIMQNRFKPAFRQQGDDERRQLSGRGLAH